MPVINGCKYSCEPCIRGHRATSCAHRDRILLEVRKPGRPLESCGHDFATCTCGRLTDFMATGQVISDPTNTSGNSQPEQPNLMLVCPPTRAPKSKVPPPRGERRASKTQRRKARSSSTSSRIAPTTQTSRENSRDRGMESTNNLTIRTSFDPVPHTSYSSYQDVGAPPGIPATFVPSNESMSQAGVRVQPPEPPQKSQGFLHQQAQQSFQAQNGVPKISQDYPGPSAMYPAYSSRVEDVQMAPQGQPQSHMSEDITSQVQSQYNLARQDNLWWEMRGDA